jgi:hypothetical protein
MASASHWPTVGNEQFGHLNNYVPPVVSGAKTAINRRSLWPPSNLSHPLRLMARNDRPISHFVPAKSLNFFLILNLIQIKIFECVTLILKFNLKKFSFF